MVPDIRHLNPCSCVSVMNRIIKCGYLIAVHIYIRVLSDCRSQSPFSILVCSALMPNYLPHRTAVADDFQTTDVCPVCLL